MPIERLADFGSGRDYAFEEFFDDVNAVGLGADVLLSTWNLHPFGDGSDFLVAILSPSTDRKIGHQKRACG